MCKFTQSFLVITAGNARSCGCLLKSATCMNVKYILYMKFILFPLRIINRKWRWLNKLTSKWRNHRRNTRMEELQKVPFLYIHVHRMGRYMVPRVNDNNPLVTQKTRFSGFRWWEGSWVRSAREASKFPNWSQFTNSGRQYMAEILPIQR